MRQLLENLRNRLKGTDVSAVTSKISVTADLVVLPVSVTDSNGAFVSGLRTEQFRVYEEGKLQKVTLFREEDAPVTAGILVDHSRSMGPKLGEVTFAVSPNMPMQPRRIA